MGLTRLASLAFRIYTTRHPHGTETVTHFARPIPADMPPPRPKEYIQPYEPPFGGADKINWDNPPFDAAAIHARYAEGLCPGGHRASAEF